jgi:hypothetical protein
LLARGKMRRTAILSAITAFTLIACSAGTGALHASDGSDGGAPGSDGAAAGPDGAATANTGVSGIYKTCAPVPLTQSLTNAEQHFSLGYPSTWQSGSGGASNENDIWRTYAYVPTGSTTPTSTQLTVAAQWGETATDANDVQRMLNDMVSGYPSASVRRFSIGGAPAIAWWFDTPPAQPGCSCNADPDPGPDFIEVGVGAARGLAILQVSARARVDAPDEVFCEIQAIEASLTFTP